MGNEKVGGVVVRRVVDGVFPLLSLLLLYLGDVVVGVVRELDSDVVVEELVVVVLEVDDVGEELFAIVAAGSPDIINS